MPESEIIFTEEIDVTVTRVEGEDSDIARAAWVSTKGERAKDEDDPERIIGLINMLARDRHGSPFEQVGFQFLVDAPIFVWREHMRHRIASYNEQSGRYSKMRPKFYMPDEDRNLVQTGKPGAYVFEPGNEEQLQMVGMGLGHVCGQAWKAYELLLDRHVAKEVARMCLPVNIFSAAYVRMNLRALTNFLSLRVGGIDWSTFPSFPQREIEMVAQQYEDAFMTHFPVAYKAWNENGRVPL